MLNSTKENHGNYTLVTYIKRGLELCSPMEFLSYMKEYLPKRSTLKTLFLGIDYYWCLIRYGATVCDYFEYQFWKKRSCERAEYATKRKAQNIQNFFNVGDKEIVIDKKKFNKKFSRFRNIGNFYFDEGDVNDFWNFVQKYNYNVIAKPFMGASGIGIFKPNVSTFEEASKIYDELIKTDNYFIEEVFVQDGILGEVNPASVNTLRIYTLFDGKDVHVMDTFVRFGGGKDCVDNIHAGGMVCEIDVQSGYIVAPGYNLLGEKFVYHPMTKYLLPGILVPRWQEVVAMIKKAASLIPEIGYLGWDVAVSDERVCIIEANEVGNLDLVQVGGQRGCLKRYHEIVDITKANRKKHG